MKILHIITSTDVGGAEQMMKRLVLRKLSSDDEHIVIGFRATGKVGRELEAAGVRVISFEMPTPLHGFLFFPKLVKLVRQLEPDVVQTWMYHADFLGGLAARIAGCRKIFWGIRNTGFPKGANRNTWFVMKASALISGWVPWKIVCCAEAAKESHVAEGYDLQKMLVVPNGFDLNFLDQGHAFRKEIRKAHGLGPEDIVLGTVGRFDPAKDFGNFIEAVGAIADKHPSLKILMVGRRIEYSNQELMAWIETQGLTDRFVLVGEQENVPGYLAAMDFFCLSSQLEAFPNVVAEAMALSLPCVVTDAGDARLMVGEAAEVVPVRDAKALAEALNELLSVSTEQREKMGVLGRRRVEEFYTLDAAVEAYFSLYNSATGVA